MGIVTVRVYTLSDVPPNDPIAGSTVRVYDVTGVVLQTAGVTNASGYFQFDILGTAAPTPTSYQVRCSKLGVGFTNPEYIQVYDPVPGGMTNYFNVHGTLLTLPVATDANLCRCSGLFVDAGGRPLPNMMLRFVNIFDPVEVTGIGVMAKVEVYTDSTGYAVVDLFRTGHYICQAAGLHDERLDITVPDRSAINIVDLLFPVVAAVTFNPLGPWAMAVGGTQVVTPTVTTSTYVTLTGTANGDVDYTTADTSIATVTVGETDITIAGVRAGATTLVLTRRDDSIHQLPVTTITGTGTVITVT